MQTSDLNSWDKVNVVVGGGGGGILMIGETAIAKLFCLDCDKIVIESRY